MTNKNNHTVEELNKEDKPFELVSKFQLTQDQKKAVNTLVENIKKNNAKYQVVLGATGTGKTFTMANVIAKLNRPAVVIAHNKTLVMQLYTEIKELFPHNHVEYFVSYFDFFQPEAYIPRTDTYIEKNSQANKDIEMMRLSTLSSISAYNDVIVVASVAAIYPTSPPSEFKKFWLIIKVGMNISIQEIKRRLVKLNYQNNNIDLKPGTFRTKGDVLEIALGSTDEYIYRISFYGDEIESIDKLDPLTGEIIEKPKWFYLIPADEYIVNSDNQDDALKNIEDELEKRIQYFNKQNKPLEAERIAQRTKQDIESIKEFGTCAGIENYARHLENRPAGMQPYTIFDYLGKEWLLLVDESHMTLPQFRGMHNTDISRKRTLVEYGFRLPSALDNRPLDFDEINDKLCNAIYFSATPNDYELNLVNNKVVEQIIRPTGLVDPKIEIKPTLNQIEDLISQLQEQKKKNERTFVTVMTIKMAESLTEFLKQRGIKVAYLHNELKTLQRTKIINDLRKGIYDVVVGINLLREGLDVPEVSLIAIFDADKPGLFRNERSLIQMIGRAARNVNGRVIMYADKITKDMDNAIKETERRRNIQLAYNKKYNITPKTIIKPIIEITTEEENTTLKKALETSKTGIKAKDKLLNKLKKEMLNAAKNQEYERAASIRDIMIEIQSKK
ncbi:MAG: excinuclease ABC subunit B [Mycoplasmataceae bacterium]|nr:excinuclease ABC subunit B [Mycoplasmataceae bacterium]